MTDDIQQETKDDDAIAPYKIKIISDTTVAMLETFSNTFNNQLYLHKDDKPPILNADIVSFMLDIGLNVMLTIASNINRYLKSDLPIDVPFLKAVTVNRIVDFYDNYDKHIANNYTIDTYKDDRKEKNILIDNNNNVVFEAESSNTVQ